MNPKKELLWRLWVSFSFEACALAWKGLKRRIVVEFILREVGLLLAV